jgi:Mn-dependent DtxR family transcriptional regulator
MSDYTQKQGQYLAFIYNYTKINRRAPAEADIQRFFNVTPPTVHQMILALEKSGFVSREPGKARTLKVLLAPDQIPYLEGHRMSRR